jgi:beta-lactamase regulating signal transducer with metallopeptidase domain
MKIDVNNDGIPDFEISITQVITIIGMFVSLIATYYVQKGRIDALEIRVEQAMEQPKQEIGNKDIDALKREYDLKIEKVAVQASENMDEIKSVAREMRNNYKRSR